MLQLDALGIDPEPLREVALEADRDVAQPDRAVPLVEQRLGDDADRVGEVQDPGPRRRSTGRLLGELEHDRHGAQRLRETACPGGLLTDGPERGRQCLVDEPGRLSTDPQLDDHEVGAVERLVARCGLDDPGGGVGLVGHPVRQTADDAEPLRVDVVEDELVDRQPVIATHEPLDELGGVRAATADDRDPDAHPASDGLPACPSLPPVRWCTNAAQGLDGNVITL